MDTYFKEIIEKINVGKAILFVGAGFSQHCINITGTTCPLADALAEKICTRGKIDPPSTDLNYTSEKYCHEGNNLNELISLLKDELTVSEVSEEVKTICTSVPWYKIYTTNYDNAVESCLPDLLPLDLTDNVNNLQIQDKRCLHINGYIEKLTLQNLNNGFYLSDETSMADIFNSSPWSTVFKNDVDRCSCLIFIGYSLSDFDIKKIIYNTAMRENIYFIVKQDISKESEYKYSKLGKVVCIGVEGFAQKIKQYSHQIKFNTINQLTSIKKYELTTNTDDTISDKDLIDMFVYGKLISGYWKKVFYQMTTTSFHEIN